MPNVMRRFCTGLLGLTLHLSAWADTQPPDLSGTWKLELNGTNQVEIPVLGSNKVRSRQVMLVHIRGNDPIIQRHRVCSLKVDSDRSVIHTIIPDPWVAALPRKEYPIEIKQREDGTWSYRADLLPLRIGYDPNVTGDELPQDIDSPGVIDWDGDGKPAATVYLEMNLFGDVEVYLVQAANTILEGTMTDDRHIDGQMLLAELRQRTIGASNRLFISNPDVKPYPPESTFKLSRVSDGSSCEDLLSSD